LFLPKFIAVVIPPTLAGFILIVFYSWQGY
jgi:hypothetical protein